MIITQEGELECKYFIAIKSRALKSRDTGFEGETFKAVPPLDVWRGSVWRKPNGQMIMLSQLATMKDTVFNSICKYELTHNNGIIHTEIEELKIRIYDHGELTETIKSCGFKVRAIKAFNSSAAPDENDESVVYECRK